MELVGRQTLFAEGCRGSCSEELIERFKLREGRDEQSYGLGIKEVWEVPADKIKPGYVQHTLGWPLQTSVTSEVFGGTFLYHMAPNLVLVGMVVGLDYPNPYLNPYKEFQVRTYHVNRGSSLWMLTNLYISSIALEAPPLGIQAPGGWDLYRLRGALLK